MIEPIFAAPGPGSVWGGASLLGVGCAILGLLPYHYAQRELPSGIATTLFASTPLFTLPLAILMGSRVGWKGVLGTIVGFFGVVGILRYGQDQPVEVQPSVGPGPEVLLTSQGSLPERQGGRKPSFLRTLPPLREEAAADGAGLGFLAIASAGPVALAPGIVTAGASSTAADPGPETSDRAVEVSVTSPRPWPVLFGSGEAALPVPRRLLQSVDAPSFARGHWADRPFGARLATGGLLIGTLQTTGAEDELGYGIRISLEADGPPALDLGWLHSDTADVLHGFGALAPLQNGGAQLIWVDDRGGDTQPGMSLFRRSIRADGTFGAESLMDRSICDCCPPDLVELNDGSFVVVYRHRSQENIRDIYWSRRDPRDGQWTQPTAVHADGWELDGCPVNGPVIAASSSTVAVAWFTQAGDAGEQQVKVAFSSDGGQSFAAPLTVVKGATLGRVELVALESAPGDQRFLLVHLAVNEDVELPGADASWRAAILHPEGAMSEFVRIADVVGSRSSGRLDLIRAGQGIVQAVWTGATGLVSAQLRCGR